MRWGQTSVAWSQVCRDDARRVLALEIGFREHSEGLVQAFFSSHRLRAQHGKGAARRCYCCMSMQSAICGRRYGRWRVVAGLAREEVLVGVFFLLHEVAYTGPSQQCRC